MVLGCSSASEVIRQAVPGTTLWKHLHDEPYRVGGAGGGGWATRKQFWSKAKEEAEWERASEERRCDVWRHRICFCQVWMFAHRDGGQHQGDIQCHPP